MSSPPPTKPPRGVKQGKETSGLLMSVIRTLSASETNEQREKERAKLEKEYKKSDARLDELVADNATEIMEVMQKFSAVNTALAGITGHSAAANARLSACRGLLRLKREDLKRLWSDARAHSAALNMLTDIERVVVSERETREALAAGKVLFCATLLRDALETANHTLTHVDALNTTRQHLEAFKHQLVTAIVKRISEAVYRCEKKAVQHRYEFTKPQELTELYMQDISAEFESSLSIQEMTLDTNIMICLEALGVIDQLKEATEQFKCHIQNELFELITSVSNRIIDDGDVQAQKESEQDGDIVEDELMSETGRPLVKLISNLTDEFKSCGDRNKRLIQLWRAALQKHKISESSLHTEHHYWSAVQQVLQLLLTEYLQIESVNLAAQRSNVAVAETGSMELKLTDYFAKKKPQRRKPKLFKITAPISGCQPISSRPHRYPLVCTPDPSHLLAVLPTIQSLTNYIQALFNNSECSLRAFITDYVRSGESCRLGVAARDGVDAALKQPASFTQTNATSTSDRRVIYSWCLTAWHHIRLAAISARRCGACGGAAASKAALVAASAALAGSAPAVNKIMPAGQSRAAKWLADDDIVRFLYSLPNWKAVSSGVEINTQELNQAYEREAEILGSSLGDGVVSRREIIADISILLDIVVLGESMDWLASNIKTIPSLITSGPSSIKLPENFLQEQIQAFQQISHKCLLFLHLELRIQCFHYVCQPDKRLQCEGETGTMKLAAALTQFHERAAHHMPYRRMQYVIGGLGEMMSAAVVWVCVNASSVNAATATAFGANTTSGSTSSGSFAAIGPISSGATGSPALAPLRHALAALSLPHRGLHAAHNYLTLLTSTPQDIIQSIKEKGSQFSELEYINLLKVVGVRHSLTAGDMKDILKQLSTALGHVGVTV